MTKRSFFPALLTVTTVAFLAGGTEACNPVGKTIARGAIDVAIASCIAANADVSDEAALREICRWADDLAPYVKELLAARQQGMRKAALHGVCVSPENDKADGGK